jgi:galactokinase
MSAGRLQQIFRQRYGTPARVFRAPGRVNLIGEHTDYNEGFVMPAAINLSILAAVGPRADSRIHAASLNVEAETEFDLNQIHRRGDWSDYVQGVAQELIRAGFPIRGANLLFEGNLPSGGGLSSSAALEVSTALALLAQSGLEAAPSEVAGICQRAENDFVGMRCGIMDQFASCFGLAGQVILLDCRSLHHRYIELPADLCLVVADTMVKHALAGGEYNLRREDCEAGASRLCVDALRDLSVPEFERQAGQLPERIRRRCRHVITENARVGFAAAALERGDLPCLGRLMAESHRSLRDDYQVSCPELDLLVGLAEKHPGVHGARMTGAGFGGCTINLVDKLAVDSLRQSLTAGYHRETGKEPVIHVCQAVDAAAELEC